MQRNDSPVLDSAPTSPNGAVRAPAPQKRSSGPKPLLLGALGLGAVVAAVVGFQWWQHAASHEETDNAYLVGHLHPVSARINGTVTRVLVDDNQVVKSGQPLVELDPRDYRVQVAQAEAALALAERQAAQAAANVRYASGKAGALSTQARGGLGAATAGIATAQAALTEAQSGVPVAEAALAEAEATLNRARLDYQRYQQLQREGAISTQQLDASRASFQVAAANRAATVQGIAQARARVAQARENLAAARAKELQSQGAVEDARATNLQIAVNQAQYEAAQAQVAQARAALAAARLQLSYTTIAAPAAGRIGRKTVEPGQRLQPGQQLLAVVGDEPWVVANFKETQLARMRPGQPVEVKIDAFGGHIFRGTIASLAPASGAQFALLPPDNATGNFTKIVQRIPVKVVFDRSSLGEYRDRLAPGMSAVVSIAVD